MRGINRMAAIVAAGVIAAPAMGQNLLGNGSFEDMGAGFNEFDVWAVFNNAFADGPMDAGNEVTAQDGDRSMKTFSGFFGPGAQSDCGANQRVAVTGGTEYTAKCWTLMLASDPLAPLDFGDPDGNGSFGHLPLLIVDFYDSVGAPTPMAGGSFEVSAFDVASDASDVWIERTLAATAPAGAVEAQVTCLLITFGDDTGALWWDNVSLEAGDVGPMPCNPADLNGDGTLNIDDIDEFVSFFLDGCP